MSRAQVYTFGQKLRNPGRPDPSRATAVLPVRLTAVELAAVEAIARKTGKTLSQVVREALHQRLAGQAEAA
jgi:hypothetical protein